MKEYVADNLAQAHYILGTEDLLALVDPHRLVVETLQAEAACKG